MKRTQDFWDKYFLRIAEVVSTASKDPSTQIGAVVVDKNNRIAGTGYNGFPRGVIDNEERYNNRELKYPRTLHAEINALWDAGLRAEGAKLYVYPSFALPPICTECCKIAIRAGINEIIGYEPDKTREERNQRIADQSIAAKWEESIKISREMCEEARIKWRTIKV